MPGTWSHHDLHQQHSFKKRSKKETLGKQGGPFERRPGDDNGKQ